MNRSLLLAAFLAFVDCKAKPRDDVHVSPSTEASAFPPIKRALSLRVHYLERAGDRCALFSLLGRERTLGATVTCPSELNDGERLRFAGRACLRESGDAARAVPTRCPADLVDAAEAREGGAP